MKIKQKNNLNIVGGEEIDIRKTIIFPCNLKTSNKWINRKGEIINEKDGCTAFDISHVWL